MKEHPANKRKRTWFEVFTEVIGWLQIAASPLLIGLALAAIIYISRPNQTTLIIGIVISLVGLIIGVIWAARKWKKKGTIEYMTTIMSTHEFDNFNATEE